MGAAATALLLGPVLAGCTPGVEPQAAPSPTASVTQEPTPSATPTPTPTPEPTTFEEVEAAYYACLEDQGSEPGLMPQRMDLSELAEMADATDEELLELGVTREAIEAHAACWPAFLEAMEDVELPEAEPSDEGAEPADPELAAKLREAVACLDERGWDLLEPGVETGPLTMEPRDPDFDMNGEAFVADQLECQRLAGMMG